MKTLFLIPTIILFAHAATAQEKIAGKQATIEDSITKAKVKVETGDEVAIWFRKPRVRRTGTIMNLSDSSLVLMVSKDQQFISFTNIESVAVIPPTKKRYMAEVIFRSEVKRTGELMRINQDSLGIMLPHANFVLLKASEIKSIRIRGKGFTGKSIGFSALAGAILGTIIGYGTFESNPSKDPIYNDSDKIAASFHGAVAGALVGLTAGVIIGLASNKYDIEYDTFRYDQFVNLFKNKIPMQKIK